MGCFYCNMSESECNSDCQYAPYCRRCKRKDLEVITTTYGAPSIKLMIDNNEKPEQKLEALNSLIREAKARKKNMSKGLNAELEKVKAWRDKALASQLEAEGRLQELEMMIQAAERERAANSVEELRKLWVSLDLSPTDALLLDEELDPTIFGETKLTSLVKVSVVSEEGVFPTPKPESDESLGQNETTY